MTVRHSQGSYNVTFESVNDFFSRLDPSAFVLTDENVDQYWGQACSSREKLVLSPGEQSKSLHVFELVQRTLAKSGLNRSSTLVAFGGGVIGDLGGFVAATYMRGIRYVQVPTTLLAMVDSSVGGKVAVDIPEGKNLVGSFYPPSEVVVDVETLTTLDDRQISNGMAEVLKYGFISDPDILVLANTDLTDSNEWKVLIERCISIKAQIVEADEFEQTGLRATLNFGHTVGHAIEALLNYEELLHGEAISIGMVVETRIGERLGVTPAGTSKLVADHLASAGLPIRHAVTDRADELISAMRLDKKAKSGHLALSLLQAMGECKLFDNVPESAVRSALQES